MANGRVDDLSWSQLRPRRSTPQYVFDSISAEALQSFTRHVSVNPFVAMYGAPCLVAEKARTLRESKIVASSGNPSVRKEPGRHQSKRRREEYLAARISSTDDDAETDSEDGDQPRRKHRRSSRPALTGSSPRTNQLTNGADSTSPSIGEMFQADVPQEPMTMAEREKNPVQVLSPLVFSEALCHGNHKIDSYLRKINNHVRRRTGFELAPFAKELALEHLAKYGSEESRAIQATLRSLPAGPYFPGIKGPFRYEEQCIFVRTLAETAKNFGYIARHVLPGRTTFELVWLYFARHKQLWLQNGGLKDGQILDDGGEKLKRVPLTTERTISALRSLAITAADGFPIDNRALQAITAVRRGILQREKKRRDDESIRHRTRLRNGFELPGVYRS